MVDISHERQDILRCAEVSKAPLIASHSSCRALCDHVRDMSDEMNQGVGGQRAALSTLITRRASSIRITKMLTIEATGRSAS